jgi:hypothetical protein
MNGICPGGLWDGLDGAVERRLHHKSGLAGLGIAAADW